MMLDILFYTYLLIIHFLCEMSVWIFCTFNRVNCLLLLSYRSSWYIVNTINLLIICFVNIFFKLKLAYHFSNSIFWWGWTFKLDAVQFIILFFCCSVAESRLTLWIPWTAICQASVFFTISWSLFRLMSIESVMPSNHLILCCPLLLLPSIFPSIRVFQWVGSLHQVAKVLEFQLQHQSFQWIFRTDFL